MNDVSHLTVDPNSKLAAVPQLSKCLKFEAVWGGIELSNDLSFNKEI